VGKNKSCYLCGGKRRSRVSGKVRDKASLGVLRCDDCGLVYLESFDHIPDDYYTEEYTERNHPGETWREVLNKCRVDDLRRAADLGSLVANKTFLDVGCGVGGVLLELKDRCRQLAGVELQERWRGPLSKAGIEVRESLDSFSGRAFDVIGLFHVLEHVKDPVPFLKKLVKMLALGGQLIIEVPSADDALLSLYHCRPFSEFTYWSPHLFLYNRRTLGMLLDKAGLKTHYIRQLQRYPLSNHLRWLSVGKPGGHIDWSFMDSPRLTAAYADQLGALGLTDTLLASAGANSA
jgi:SAM-dependent methyltransferase